MNYIRNRKQIHENLKLAPRDSLEHPLFQGCRVPRKKPTQMGRFRN